MDVQVQKISNNCMVWGRGVIRCKEADGRKEVLDKFLLWTERRRLGEDRGDLERKGKVTNIQSVWRK